MAEQLNTELFVMDILNDMTQQLTDIQISSLKTILYIKLHDVSLVKQNYDLVTTIKESDYKKVEYFAVAKKLEGRCEDSIKQYIRTAWALRNYIGRNFEDITTEDIRWYFGRMQLERKWSNSYTNTQRIYLNVFFKFLFTEKYIIDNPVSRINPIKCEKVIKHPYSVTEIERIRGVCAQSDRDRALVEFLYSTGLRVSNVAGLKWNELDMHDRSLSVRLKGGKYKQFYFNKKSLFYLYKLLEQRMNIEHRTMEEMMDRPVFACKRRNSKTKDWEALTDDDIRYVLNEIARKAHLDKVHPHKFRRTFACRSINLGMPLAELKEHMGHENYDTTLIYAEIDNATIKQSYRKYWD